MNIQSLINEIRPLVPQKNEALNMLDYDEIEVEEIEFIAGRCDKMTETDRALIDMIIDIGYCVNKRQEGYRELIPV